MYTTYQGELFDFFNTYNKKKTDYHLDNPLSQQLFYDYKMS